MQQSPGGSEIRQDRERQVFELVLADEVVGYAPYEQESDGVIVVPYVEIVPERRGQGLGAVLADGLLAEIRSSGQQVVPTCGWLASYVRENPGHHDLVASRI